MLLLLHSLCFFLDVLDCSDIEKCILRILVHLTIYDGLEALDSLLYRHIDTLDTCEVLGYVEWLSEELLDFSCSVYKHLVLICQLLHTEDCDDILQLLVLLENLLYLSCYLIMLLAYDIRLEDT